MTRKEVLSIEEYCAEGYKAEDIGTDRKKGYKEWKVVPID